MKLSDHCSAEKASHRQKRFTFQALVKLVAVQESSENLRPFDGGSRVNFALIGRSMWTLKWFELNLP